ncbi:MAG: Hint domain-containing protein [Myxococcales bacterium]
MARRSVGRLITLPVLSAAVAFGACGFPFGCIARGALIATPRGPRRIEELAVGDDIFSVDESQRTLVPATITAVRALQRECASLATESGAALKLTTDHPIFDPVAKVYAPAGDWVLKHRTTLLVLRGEVLVPDRVTSVSDFVSTDEVFDLTVDSAHHNFVANGVLVHNKDPPVDPCERPVLSCKCPRGFAAETFCRNGVEECTCERVQLCPSFETESCTCFDGIPSQTSCFEDGTVQCDCRQVPDGGDAGRSDAGAEDAGSADAGNEADAGHEDGGTR